MSVLPVSRHTDTTGAREIATVLAGGGTENIKSGGAAVSGMVRSGGVAAVSSGGTATGDVVSSGGIEAVLSGGSGPSGSRLRQRWCMALNHVPDWSGCDLIRGCRRSPSRAIAMSRAITMCLEERLELNIS
jgi:autotransporter passenger strand-loop-strand repeat protein